MPKLKSHRGERCAVRYTSHKETQWKLLAARNLLCTKHRKYKFRALRDYFQHQLFFFVCFGRCRVCRREKFFPPPSSSIHLALEKCPKLFICLLLFKRIMEDLWKTAQKVGKHWVYTESVWSLTVSDPRDSEGSGLYQGCRIYLTQLKVNGPLVKISSSKQIPIIDIP